MFFWILSSSPSDGSRQRVWVCPLGMEVASYPRVIWNFITENIVRYIDFQKSPLILLYLYPLLKPKMGQKCEHGRSARKTWRSYCASPILSWDGVRNTNSMPTDKVTPILAAARCWIGLGRVWFGILIEDVLAKPTFLVCLTWICTKKNLLTRNSLFSVILPL